ncbi:MAG TPA: PAS domain S-box protein [Bryobacteraceae bacterium]|nr:PAS domain S-box protein [Bryobacteraceae bacterium]
MPQGHPAEFLQALLDASPLGVVAVDKSGLIKLWSSGAQRILGWCEEDLIGRPVPLEAKLPSHPNYAGDILLGRNDGTLVDAEVRNVPWQGGTLTILTDISRHRMAQHEIQELTKREEEAKAQSRADRRFRELLEAAPDAIIEVDRDGRIVLLNPVTEKLFGYPHEELLGQSVDILLPDELRGAHAGHRAHFWAQPVTRPMGMGLVLYGRRKDGSSFPVEISLSPVKSEEGFRVTAIIRDVTDRRQTEERLQRLREDYTRELELRNQEVERANRLKSEFLANMSHELRTPLHTVIGFSELLNEEMKGPLNPDQKRFIGHIHRDAQHLLSLINEILDLSKIEAGKVELRFETLDLTGVIEDTLASIRPQCAEKSIRIETHVPRSILVSGDRVRTRQILYNLLSNAVKFTPDGGRIGVEAVRVDGFAQVSVIDTGIGISAEDHESIFDKFHQVGSATTGLREGTGLGLPITRHLVEEHGGRIWLESERGKGSRFTFTIPLGQPNEKSAHSGR